MQKWTAQGVLQTDPASNTLSYVSSSFSTVYGHFYHRVGAKRRHSCIYYNILLLEIRYVCK